MSLQKNELVKFCNCRNSKCMKLYCECFAARIQCGTYCHCIDCHNKNNAEHLKIYKDYNTSDRKTFKQELAKQHKGCACRKSGCTKKYCECYQAGLLCRDICKCIDCQNNESLSNKKVISDLKRNTSSASNKGPSLYPIILTQDNRHLNQILADQNPLNLQDEWIEKTVQELYKKAGEGSFSGVLQKMIDVLSLLQSDTIFHSQGQDYRNQTSELRNEQQNQQNEQKQQLKFQAIKEEQIKRQHNFNYNNSNENSEPMDEEEPQYSSSEGQNIKDQHFQ